MNRGNKPKPKQDADEVRVFEKDNGSVNPKGGSMINETVGMVKNTANTIKNTQVEAFDLTKQVLIGETAKDGIVGILNTILPIPPVQLEMLKSMPEVNSFLMVLLGTVVNENFVHSERGEKILVAATSSTQVDLAKKYKLHTLGKLFKEKIEELADGNIFSGLFGDFEDTEVDTNPKEKVKE